MTEAFCSLSDSDLAALGAALRSRRLAAPYNSLQLSRYVPKLQVKAIGEVLQRLFAAGFIEQQIAMLIDSVILDRRTAKLRSAEIDLVTSGPEAPGVSNRDTSVVVRELFAQAERSVMVVGYAVYQGQAVFEALASRMEEVPALDVQMFLNIQRGDGDTTDAAVLVTKFAYRFKETQWPAGFRIPTVYYDPRSLQQAGTVRSSMHAKCVVVDNRHVFVSSANFTEAAQLRNIEVGLKVNSPALAHQIIQHFRHLVDSKMFLRALG